MWFIVRERITIQFTTHSKLSLIHNSNSLTIHSQFKLNLTHNSIQTHSQLNSNSLTTQFKLTHNSNSNKHPKRLLTLQLRLLQKMQRLKIMHSLHLLQPRNRSVAREHFIQHRVPVQLEQLRQRRLRGANQLHLVLVQHVHQRNETTQLRHGVHREHGDVLQHHGVELVAYASSPARTRT